MNKAFHVTWMYILKENGSSYTIATSTTSTMFI